MSTPPERRRNTPGLFVRTSQLDDFRRLILFIVVPNSFCLSGYRKSLFVGQRSAEGVADLSVYLGIIAIRRLDITDRRRSINPKAELIAVVTRVRE